jgi:hypothetical protein
VILPYVIKLLIKSLALAALCLTQWHWGNGDAKSHRFNSFWHAQVTLVCGMLLVAWD